jgi:hypothetical protein
LRLSLMRLCHRTPALRWVGRTVPRSWFFKRVEWNIAVLAGLSGYRRADVLAIRRALNGNFPAREIEAKARKYLVYRRWRRNLLDAWPNWADRLDSWCELKGENHLTAALASHRGAILLSGHDFGFAPFVSPILAQRGLKLFRAGMGRRAHRMTRWGKGAYRRWEYLGYHGSSWHRLRVLHRMHEALKAGGVLQIEIAALPDGDARMAMPLCHKRFFLDAAVVRLLETLKAPVLPCFSLCDEAGKVIVEIHPAVPPDREEIVRTFGGLYADYLRNFPECSPVWKKLGAHREEF